TAWRLNDIGWSKWWGLGIFILSGMLYIDNDAILNIGLVISFVIVVVMSYVPGEDMVKKIEADLDRLSIEHRHMHDANFCIQWKSRRNGKKFPKVYVIDFDQAVSK
ncbi:MAG: hypothetical protein Q7S92_04250, partial [Candidatus Diapherotrites archaeon]|nr:hypothetical protein [Candidatus Diapherotrites archaeon]